PERTARRRRLAREPIGKQHPFRTLRWHLGSNLIASGVTSTGWMPPPNGCIDDQQIRHEQPQLEYEAPVRRDRRREPPHSGTAARPSVVHRHGVCPSGATNVADLSMSVGGAEQRTKIPASHYFRTVSKTVSGRWVRRGFK